MYKEGETAEKKTIKMKEHLQRNSQTKRPRILIKALKIS